MVLVGLISGFLVCMGGETVSAHHACATQITEISRQKDTDNESLLSVSFKRKITVIFYGTDVM